MNALSGGLAVSAFYLHTQRVPELAALMTGLLPGVLILLSAALLALNAGREGRFLLRDVSFGSFGAAMLIGLAVLVVITEGDALDGLDAGFDLPDGGQPAKKNRAEGYMTR